MLSRRRARLWVLAAMVPLAAPAFVGCRHDAERSLPPADASRPPVESWPALPAHEGDARALVQRHRRRPAAGELLDLRVAVERELARALRPVVGWAAIRRWLERWLDAASARDSYLLWGTYHDAGEQLAAFARLIGPGGPRPFSQVVVEQFDADGRWQGPSRRAQMGDDAALAAFGASGDRAAFQALRRRQSSGNYTGWKYGYLGQVMRVPIAARAAGSQLLACDMPLWVQRRLAPMDADVRDRLRELHCLLHLADAIRGARRPLRVAMAWGQAHLHPQALVRLLPADAAVLAVQVYGHRPGAGTPEQAIGRRLTLMEPLLIPDTSGSPRCGAGACVERVALLLPGNRLGGVVDRSRDALGDPAAPPGRTELEVGSTLAGKLTIGGTTLTIGPRATVHRVGAGPSPYRLVTTHGTLLGTLTLPTRGRVTMRFEPTQRRVRLVIRSLDSSRRK